MTAWETKRASRPSPRAPKPASATPLRLTRRNIAPPRCDGGYAATAWPAVRADALVVAICMSWVLCSAPPARGPAMLV